MNYYVYDKARLSRKQTIVLTLIACLVVIIVTGSIVTNISHNKELHLKNQITAYNDQVKALEEVKSKYDTLQDEVKLIEQYKDDIKTKETQIKELTVTKEDLSKQNASMENTLKRWAAVGIKPANYQLAPRVSRGGDRITKKTYVGEWLGTYYAPNKDECGDNKGITASSLPVIPGKTIAVDPKYWKLGTRFWIEGIGEVVATDTGSAIKGRERFDLCVFSTDISHSGNFKAKVYLIEDER